MRFITLLVLSAVQSIVKSVPFDSANYFPNGPFGVTTFRERSIPPTEEVKVVKLTSQKSEVKQVKADAADDYDMAESAVFHAVERVEKEVAHAIEDEVDVLFHKDPTPVQVEDRSPSKKSEVKQVKADAADDYDMAEDAIFRAVERVEEKVVHAIEDEVDSLYHKDPKSVVQVKDVGEEVVDKDAIFHAVEKMYD